jgi:hypothetical protein
MSVSKEPEVLIQTDPLSGQPFRSEAQDPHSKKAGAEEKETQNPREKKAQTY